MSSNYHLYHGKCEDVLKEFEENSMDSIVTDPPYGYEFMNKDWDKGVPPVSTWKECLRVLKPGGYLLSFAGTRTYHQIATNIEAAGFEIRDMIAWIYGSGFPKSLNIGKAVDKLQGNKREEIENKYKSRNPNGKYGTGTSGNDNEQIRTVDIDTKGTSEWEGWGTALKPALEPIAVARKPLSEKSVALNVLKHGTGGINIDASRVPLGKEKQPTGSAKRVFANNGYNEEATYGENVETSSLGRYPANLIHDGSPEVKKIFPDAKSGGVVKGTEESNTGQNGIYSIYNRIPNDPFYDSGSAARFFYCAKATVKDREEGLEDLEYKIMAASNQAQAEVERGNLQKSTQSGVNTAKLRKNNHPTVKPTPVMRYLVKLVTPKGGKCCDPFMGSGSTGKACNIEEIIFYGIEKEENSFIIAEKRISTAGIGRQVLFDF